MDVHELLYEDVISPSIYFKAKRRDLIVEDGMQPFLIDEINLTIICLITLTKMWS